MSKICSRLARFFVAKCEHRAEVCIAVGVCSLPVMAMHARRTAALVQKRCFAPLPECVACCCCPCKTHSVRQVRLPKLFSVHTLLASAQVLRAARLAHTLRAARIAHTHLKLFTPNKLTRVRRIVICTSLKTKVHAQITATKALARAQQVHVVQVIVSPATSASPLKYSVRGFLMTGHTWLCALSGCLVASAFLLGAASD
jgi:hypothetical protein